MKNFFFFFLFAGFMASAFAQPYYVAGDFQGWVNNANIMYDDGTNGDLVAGDSIYSLQYTVAASGYHGWKVTNGTWNITYPAANSWFETAAANQAVLFTFNTKQMNDGWRPNTKIVCTNEVKPTNLVAVGDWQSEVGEAGDWTNNSTITRMRDDGLDGDWTAGDGIFVYHISTLPAGSWQGKAVHSGTWHSWGADGRSEDGVNLQFTTTSANQHVYIYVNTNTGRVTFSYNSPVPVELTSFTANVSDYTVTLNWTTATETNNKGFEVQKLRVKSEELNSANWETIAFVAGNGTVSEPRSYSYSDKVAPGKYSYRLKQTDFDGSFEYSSAVEADVNPATFSLEQNYPNPFNPSTRISFSIPSAENVTVKLYDLTGKEVATVVDSRMDAGRHEVTLRAEGLASGVYMFKLTAGAFTSTKKLSVLK